MSKKLPEGWKRVNLGGLVNIKTGKLDANASSEDGEYPFFTCSVQPLKISSYNYECECVLVAGNGDLNVKYYDGKFDAYQRTYIIESIDKNVLSVKYLYYFMSKYIDVLRIKSIGGVIKYIKLGDLTSASIPIPSLEEQERIVSILEKAEKVIQKREESNRLLDEYLKSVFVDMFGDVINNQKGFSKSELGNYIDFLTSGSRGWAKYYSDNGEIFITIKNVKNSKLYFHDITYVTAPNTKEAERTRVKKDDLLISITADLGRTAVVDKETAELGAYINQHLCLVRLSKSLNPIFTSYLLESDSCKTIIDSYNQVGVKSGLNFEAIKSIPIFVPSIELQEKFVQIVYRVESMKNKKLESKTELKNLFNSLMKKAFNGEL